MITFGTSQMEIMSSLSMMQISQQFLEMHRSIENKEMHTQLQDDLVEHHLSIHSET
jgi:hypothetical protein